MGPHLGGSHLVIIARFMHVSVWENDIDKAQEERFTALSTKLNIPEMVFSA